MASEAELIAALGEIFFHPRPDILLGIGDDGAVIRVSQHDQVAVADMAVEGVHFKRSWSGLAEIGAKIAAANFADIFAMGAKPSYILITAGLPKDFSVVQIRELANGIQAECNLVGAVAVGGDLSISETMVISITAIGSLENNQLAIPRSGAQVGESIVISDLPGWSAAGLEMLQSGKVLDAPAAKRALDLHRKPKVGYEKAALLAESGATSMIDISDGLHSELKHLAKASRVQFSIDPELVSAIPEFELLKALAEDLDVDVWKWVLGGGEDHHFLATLEFGMPIPDGTWVIGRTNEGSGIAVRGIPAGFESGYRHFG